MNGLVLLKSQMSGSSLIMAKFNYSETEQQLIIQFDEKKLDWTASENLMKPVLSEIDKVIGKDQKSEHLRIVFDLSGAEYVSSAFLRLVIRVSRRVSKENMKVINASTFISNVMKGTGLSSLLI